LHKVCQNILKISLCVNNNNIRKWCQSVLTTE